MGRGAVAVLAALGGDMARVTIVALGDCGGRAAVAALAVLVGNWRRGGITFIRASGAHGAVVILGVSVVSYCGVVVDGLSLGVSRGFLGEVVVADGEFEGVVDDGVAHSVAIDETDCGDVALCGEGVNVGSVDEEVLAEVACSVGFLAQMVVTDEEEGGLGVIGDVADDMAEVGGLSNAAEGHEVVDVVDDDEVGLELLEEGLDVSNEGIVVVTFTAEDIKADEVETILVNGACCEFVVNVGTNVRAVEGVYPEDPTGRCSDGAAAHAGPVVGLAGLAAG